MSAAAAPSHPSGSGTSAGLTPQQVESVGQTFTFRSQRPLTKPGKGESVDSQPTAGASGVSLAEQVSPRNAPIGARDPSVSLVLVQVSVVLVCHDSCCWRISYLFAYYVCRCAYVCVCVCACVCTCRLPCTHGAAGMILIFIHWQLEMERTEEETFQSPFLAITTTATVGGTLMMVSFDALLLFLVGLNCPLPLS